MKLATMNIKTATLLGTALCLGFGMHAAPVILPVTYQGRLLDETNPANGQYEVRFGLFPSPTGGSELEAMTNVITASNGLFTTMLNLDRDLIPDPASGDRWLEIGVRTNGSASAFTVLSARQQLTFSPYAIRASVATLAENLPANSVADVNIQSGTITADKLVDGAGSGLDADLLDGLDSSAFATATHNHYGETWTGSATIGLSVGTDNTNTIGTAALRGRQGSGAGFSPYSPTGVWGDSDSGNGVFGSSGSGSGVIGISTSFIGVEGYGGAIGVLARSDEPAGKGLWAQATDPSGTNYGLQATSYSTNGTGVWGQHIAVGGTTPGVLGETASTTGYAAGVIGRVTSTSPGSYSAGVLGINEGTGSLGIGVYGYQNGSGWGVYGESVSGYGVYAHSGNGYGVYAAGGNGHAIYAAGSVNADRLVYNNPRTHYLFVPGYELKPRQIDSTTSYFGDAGGAYLDGGYDSVLQTPLHLPDGAVITSFHAYFDDNSTQNLSAGIWRHDTHFSYYVGYTNVVSVDSSGISGLGNKTVLVSGSLATIQNNAYFYMLEAFSSGTWSTAGFNLRIEGVIVTYTISEAE